MALVGKPCPRISSLVFIKGEPVAIPGPGPVIVEFWASWCGPCRAAFPHLSQLAKKFQDSGLRVVGVSMEEEAPSRAFVSSQGSKMDYAVAIDPGQATAQALLGAAGVSGIPHAFVVSGAGVIVHHGHPMEPAFAAAVERACKDGGATSPQPPPQQQEQRPLPAVASSREELMALPVRELKAILTDRKIGFGDLSEKGELVDRILERCKGVIHYA